MLRRIFLSGLLVSAAMPSMAQDVVMRRPLPNSTQTQTGCTPGQPGCPAPTPTPTPTGDPYDPIKPLEQTVANEAHGYDIDCASGTSTCYKIEYTGPSSTANIDYGAMRYTVVPSCPATQSPQADSLAQLAGLIPVGSAGASQGQAMCNAPDPAGNRSVYGSFSFCEDNAKALYCTRYIFPSQFTPGSDPISSVRMADNSKCISQSPSDPAFVDLSSRYGFVAPGAISSMIGQACRPATQYSVDGGRCVTDQQGQPAIACRRLYVNDDGEGNLQVDSQYQDPSACMVDQTLDASQRSVVAQYGLLPPSSDILSKCGSPDLYGANKQCVTKVTYDAGWPQNGQSHVDTQPVVGCYAIYGKDTPDISLQQVDESRCQSNLPDSADRAFLRSLAPDLYPYDELPQQCSTQGGVSVNYQRSTVGSNVTFSRGPDENPPSFDGSILYRYTSTFTVPYVCTDAVQGDYYAGGRPSQVHSTYDISKHNACINGRDYDIAALQADGVNMPSNSAPDRSELLSNVQAELVRQGHVSAQRCGPGAYDEAAVVTAVVDEQDQSKLRVTFKGSCFNPIG